MSEARVPQVAALVVGAQGGARLARALAGVAWAGERIVLDPAERLAAERFPDGVRRVTGTTPLAELTAAPWLLLVAEDEVVAPAVATLAAAVAADAGAAGAYRLGQEVHAHGARLRLAGKPLRLARRAGAELRLGPALGLALATPPGRVGLAPDALTIDGPSTIGAVVGELDADGSVLAAVLHARGVRPWIHRLVLAPLAAAGRVVLGRARPGLGWDRWVLAVVAGYRVVVAYAKLWELRRDRTPFLV
jgi:hypothetical protein